MKVREIGERGIISRLKGLAPIFTEEVLSGIGEDCAVIKMDEKNIILATTDMLVEGVHFKLDTISPYQLGRKVLSVNLSDIAAMGGWPTYAFLSMGLRDSTAVEFIDEIVGGFNSIAQKYEVSLVGGDTISSPCGLIINVLVLGKGEPGKVVYRSGARPGDIVYVNGFLGDAAAGLEILNRGIDVASNIRNYLVKAHLDPVPPLEIGSFLAKSGMVHAMIDVSDGIASDMWHICEESGVGARISKELIPISEACNRLADILETSPLKWALSGGEDYRLLFTAPKRHKAELENLIRTKLDQAIFAIGEITEGHSVYLVDGEAEENISSGGFDHFAAEVSARSKTKSSGQT